MARLLLASGLGLVRLLKSVYGSHAGQPRCRLGFAHVRGHSSVT